MHPIGASERMDTDVNPGLTSFVMFDYHRGSQNILKLVSRIALSLDCCQTRLSFQFLNVSFLRGIWEVTNFFFFRLVPVIVDICFRGLNFFCEESYCVTQLKEIIFYCHEGTPWPPILGQSSNRGKFCHTSQMCQARAGARVSDPSESWNVIK
jgi:hypothetical protein